MSRILPTVRCRRLTACGSAARGRASAAAAISATRSSRVAGAFQNLDCSISISRPDLQLHPCLVRSRTIEPECTNILARDERRHAIGL